MNKNRIRIKKQNQDQQNKDMNDNQSDGQKISQDDARRLLEALASDEKRVQDKVQKDKAAAAMVRTLKNW